MADEHLRISTLFSFCSICFSFFTRAMLQNREPNLSLSANSEAASCLSDRRIDELLLVSTFVNKSELLLGKPKNAKVKVVPQVTPSRFGVIERLKKIQVHHPCIEVRLLCAKGKCRRGPFLASIGRIGKRDYNHFAFNLFQVQCEVILFHVSFISQIAISNYRRKPQLLRKPRVENLLKHLGLKLFF